MIGYAPFLGQIRLAQPMILPPLPAWRPYLGQAPAAPATSSAPVPSVELSWHERLQLRLLGAGVFSAYGFGLGIVSFLITPWSRKFDLSLGLVGSGVALAGAAAPSGKFFDGAAIIGGGVAGLALAALILPKMKAYTK